MRFVVGVTGASGVILAYRTLLALTSFGHEVDLVMTQSAIYTAAIELGKEYTTALKLVKKLPQEQQKKVTIHPIQDVGASISSGSYPTDGMLIIPCSMATMAAVNIGLADNALRRAADVTLKEKRPLVIVPRESPFSEIHLENMLSLHRKGAIIVPPVPAWYNEPKGMEDVENFIVGKALDALKIEHNIYKRWKC